mgnify:CR=1 FL=1
MSLFRRLPLVLLSALALVAGLSAQISGSVTNGTTPGPVAGASVALIQLQGGMQPVADTHTDAAGHFSFSQSAPAGVPMLLKVEYKGVPYFQPLPPNQTQAVVEVFEPSADESQLHLSAHLIVVQPEQLQMAVVDEYVLENTLEPKRTLYRDGGLFRFRVPTGTQPDGARVIGPSGMPISRPPVPTASNGIFTVDYPVRPGETRIQVSYRVPYGSLHADLTEHPLYPTDHLRVYVPAPMQFTGANFAPVGQQDGFKVYEAQGAVRPDDAGAGFRFTVSGDAPPPASDSSASQGSTTTATQPAGDAAAVPDQAAPPKTFLERNLWVILAFLVMGAAGGFGYLLSRPKTAGAPQSNAPAVGRTGDDPLGRLRDELFLLEVRRTTGDIGAAEYQTARAALDRRMKQLAGKSQG